jgi:hypothetical protein
VPKEVQPETITGGGDDLAALVARSQLLWANKLLNQEFLQPYQ